MSTRKIHCTPFQPTSKATYKHCDHLIKATPSSPPIEPYARGWRLQPTVLPAKYAQFADAIANFEVRPDDIWLVTLPKCGTTWTQEMIRLLHNDKSTYAEAAREAVHVDFQFLELCMLFDIPAGNDDAGLFTENSVDRARDQPSPRCIKSHLPIELLPAQLWTVRPRIVHVARNPKDVAVSFFHHYRNIYRYSGTFDEFMTAFLADEVIYAPFAPHTLNFWSMRDEENVLFLTYEEMKVNMMDVLRRTQRFLGKCFGDEELEQMAKHLHVDNMRENKDANNSWILPMLRGAFKDVEPDKDFQFVRKGMAGTFRAEMSAELIAKFDAKTSRDFAGVDFKFDM